MVIGLYFGRNGEWKGSFSRSLRGGSNRVDS